MKENMTAVVTRKPIKGEVVSLSKDLTTAKVSISRIVPDKTYGKRLHLNTEILADAKGHQNLQVGNFVEILPCRKVSKRKSWKVLSICKK